MNSAAWLVEAGDGSRLVVKASAASDAAGLAVAERLQERGFRAGGPVRMLLTEEGGLVSLLRFVPGRPLTHADAEVVGETLGRVHSLLAGPGSGRARSLALALAGQLLDRGARPASGSGCRDRRGGSADRRHQPRNLQGDPDQRRFWPTETRSGRSTGVRQSTVLLLDHLASAYTYSGPASSPVQTDGAATDYRARTPRAFPSFPLGRSGLVLLVADRNERHDRHQHRRRVRRRTGRCAPSFAEATQRTVDSDGAESPGRGTFPNTRATRGTDV